MEKKQSVAAFLFAAVLLAVSFAPLSGQQNNNYDPWLDYNEDGTVDASDLQAIGESYGASGSRSRNVNVTNWPTEPEPRTAVVVQNRTLDPPGLYFAFANVEGYRYVSIFVSYRRGSGSDCVLRAQPSCADITRDWDGTQNIYGRVFRLYFNGYPAVWEHIVSTRFEVGAPYIGFWFEGQTSTELTLVLFCYN